LDQDFATGKSKSTTTQFRSPSPDPAEGDREPVLGRASHSRELLKLGTEISERTVFRLIPKYRKPPSQTWKALLNKHVQSLVSVDFFTVPTVSFRVLFVFVVLAHHRRRVMHFNVTEHLTTAWTAQQILEAFPEATAPRYLIRDRDPINGECFRNRLRDMDITEVLTAPQSPWQNPFAERLVASIRCECLDHVIVLGEKHLRRILKGYLITIWVRGLTSL